MCTDLSGDVSGLLPYTTLCWFGKADRKITLVQGSSYPGGFWTMYLPNKIMERDMSLCHWRRISVVKAKLSLPTTWRRIGEVGVQLHLSLTSAVDEGWVISFTSRPLYPEGKNPGTHAWTPIACLDFWNRKENLSPDRNRTPCHC